jgi:hypothetical protein
MFCGKWSPKDGAERFCAEGEMRLLGAQIGGQLSFGNARLTKPHQGVSLYLERAEAVELWLPHHTPPEGIVDLTDARVAQLHDKWSPADQEDGEPFRYGLRVNGFVYESLAEGSDSRSGLDWIRRAEQESARAERESGRDEARAKRRSNSPHAHYDRLADVVRSLLKIAQPKEDESGYLPRAYDQLAAVFRSAGREEDARAVAIQKLRRRRRKLRWPARVWNHFLEWTVGYGYRTWRAVYALLGLWALGWGVFAQASWDHLTETRAQRPQFEPWLYSIDAVLPVINLGQESAWSPTGLFFQTWYAFSVLAGWVFATALVAALTATLFRE